MGGLTITLLVTIIITRPLVLVHTPDLGTLVLSIVPAVVVISSSVVVVTAVSSVILSGVSVPALDALAVLGLTRGERVGPGRALLRGIVGFFGFVAALRRGRFGRVVSGVRAEREIEQFKGLAEMNEERAEGMRKKRGKRARGAAYLFERVHHVLALVRGHELARFGDHVVHVCSGCM